MRSQKSYTVEEAQKALEHYCSYQERTHKEVDQKLQSLGMIPLVREEILVYLLQNNFLNEERFARAYARGKFNQNRWGRVKIKQNLLQKGISEANIKIGLTEIDPDAYIEMIQRLAEKYEFKNKGKNSYEKKQKLIRYLQQKGYEFDLIYKSID